MTPQERLITMKEGATLDEAQALMHKHRLERVLIVNDKFQLRGLATVKDIVKNTEHPIACKDAQGQLRVGGEVGVGDGTEERVEKLANAGEIGSAHVCTPFTNAQLVCRLLFTKNKT